MKPSNLRRRLSTLLALVTLLAVIPTVAALADHPDGVHWVGNGVTDGEFNTEICNDPDHPDPYIHWVYTGNGSSVELFINDISVGFMEQGGGGQGAFHFYSDYSDLEDIEAYVVVVGEGGGGLVISHGCPPDEFVPEPALSVTKTAVGSYDLSHAWDITKLADLTTVNLFTDGSGDSLVTWTVDVTYEGSTISNESVAGTITLDNTGNVDARIDTLDDVLDTGEVGAVACPEPVSFVIPAGDSVDCTYTVDPDGIVAELNTATATGEFAIDEEGTFDGSSLLNEDGTAEVVFAVGTETDATVNINDLSDLFGDVALGSVTAPNGDTFTYDQQFSYADYGQAECGTHTYNNTARIVETGQTADESVTVNVQCLIFQGETATGYGTAWKLTNRAPNNWFMFTSWADIADGGANIIAGQFYDVGDVTGIRNGTTTLNFTLDGDWELADAVGNVKINPMSCTTNQSYKQPGQFARSFTVDPDNSGSFSVSGLLNTDCYGIHLSVGQWVPDPNFPPA